MILLAGVDRGGGGQHSEGSEFENGDLHDWYDVSVLLFVFYDDVYAAPTTAHQIGFGFRKLILTRVVVRGHGTWVCIQTNFHVEPDLWTSNVDSH